jgi:hypothetical protein
MMLSAYLLEDTLPEVLLYGRTARSDSARRARRC